MTCCGLTAETAEALALTGPARRKLNLLTRSAAEGGSFKRVLTQARKKGLDIHVPHRPGNLLVWVAAARNNSVLHALIKAGADVDVSCHGVPALHVAALVPYLGAMQRG